MAVTLHEDPTPAPRSLRVDEIKYGVLYDMYLRGQYRTKVIRVYHSTDKGSELVKVVSVLHHPSRKPGEGTWVGMSSEYEFEPSKGSVTIDGKPCGGGGLQ